MVVLAFALVLALALALQDRTSPSRSTDPRKWATTPSPAKGMPGNQLRRRADEK